MMIPAGMDDIFKYIEQQIYYTWNKKQDILLILMSTYLTRFLPRDQPKLKKDNQYFFANVTKK